jgi:O-antigen ligase
MGSLLGRTARIIVIAALVLAAWLPYGAIQPWACLCVCLVVGVGMMVWLLSAIVEPPVRLRAPALTLMLAALAAAVCAQILPLPLGIVERINPVAASAQKARVELFAGIEAHEFLPVDLPLDDVGKATISACPSATRRSLYLLVACVGAFLVMANTITEWEELGAAAATVVVSCFFLAVFGLVQYLSGTNRIYWYLTPQVAGSHIFGPFVNRNHFAAHMNMALGLTVGLLAAVSLSSRSRRRKSWRARLVDLSTGRASLTTLLGFAAMLIGATVVVSLSRGGILCLGAALGVVGMWSTLRRRDYGRIWLAGVVLVLAVVSWLGWEPVVERMGTLAEAARDTGSSHRAVLARDSMRMFRAAPVFGSGLGSFRHVYPMFGSQEVHAQGRRRFFALNDYAQLLAEGGVACASLVAAAAAAFVASVWRRLEKAADKSRRLVVGLAIGLLATVLHSALDFSLRVPPNALLLAILCGICVAAVNLPSANTTTRERKETPRVLPETQQEKAAQAT